MFLIVIVGVLTAVVVVMVMTSVAVLDVAFQGAGVPAGSSGQSERPHCPSGGEHRIAVTPPEVLAIAEQLRHTFPDTEVQRIREKASRSARLARGLTAEQYALAGIPCPLLVGRDGCLTFESRPMHCRNGCFESGAGGNRCDCKAAEQGAGIARGLAAAGLECDRYELNAALATALSSPDIARQWAAGEPVFSGCR